MAARRSTFSEQWTAAMRPLRNRKVLGGLAALTVCPAAAIQAARGNGADEWTFGALAVVALLAAVVSLRRAARSVRTSEVRLPVWLAVLVGADGAPFVPALALAVVATFAVTLLIGGDHPANEER